jgi:hypothetical protein
MIIDQIYDIDENEMHDFKYYNLPISDYLEPVFYDQFEFHDYHQKFADKVIRLWVKSADKLLGYCYVGVRDHEVRIPYSAPFSLIYVRSRFKICEVCLFIRGLKNFAAKKGLKSIRISLPPEIYGSEIINVLSSAFVSEGFKVKSVELNNYFDLSDYDGIEGYLKKSPYQVRRNYKRAISNGLEFKEIDTTDFGKAYDIIRINREQMGYLLNISEQHMNDLITMNSSLIRAFIVSKLGKPIAAALIFDVTEEVSQVVYWGDILEYRKDKPMDLLATEIFHVYKLLGKKYLDIGPSSKDGIINKGLAEFKLSVGCNTNIKVILEYLI